MMNIDGKNYELNEGDIRRIGHFYLRNLFAEHLHEMTAYYCNELSNEEVESARKQIEESESLTDDFLEDIMQKFFDDEVLDTLCEDTILEMNLDLDEEDDDDE